MTCDPKEMIAIANVKCLKNETIDPSGSTIDLFVEDILIDNSDDDSILSISPDGPKQSRPDDVSRLTAEFNQRIRETTEAALAKALKKDTKGSDFENESRRHSAKLKPADFPAVPKTPNTDNVHNWCVLVTNQLQSPHWCLRDGSSIYDQDDDANNSSDFACCSRTLARLLNGRLTVDDHVEAVDQFTDLNKKGHGVSFLHAMREHLDPQTERTAIHDFHQFREILQKSGDTVRTVARAITSRCERLKKSGCCFGDGRDLKKFQLLIAVTTGACSRSEAFTTFAQDIIQGRFSVGDHSFEELAKKPQDLMHSAGMMQDLQALPANSPKIRRMAGGDSSQSPLPIATNGDNPWFGQTELDEVTARMQFQLTNCIFCKHPKNHQNSHWLSDCPRLKKLGCAITHDNSKDTRYRNDQPSQPQTPPAPPSDDAKLTRTQQRQKAQKAAKARKAAAARQKSSDDSPGEAPENTPRPNTPPPSTPNPDGSVRRAQTSAAPDEADYDDRHFGGSSVVDLHDNVENEVSDCLPLPHLSEFDHAAADGTRVACVGRASHRLRVMTRKTKVTWCSDGACLDTGATADVLNDRRHFGDDCTPVQHMKVCMGDGTPVPVKGRGTARIEIDGKVIVLPSALHTPTLDCNLLSVTMHALRGQGCGHFAMSGRCTMAFPAFTVSRKTPSSDNDPMFPLEKLEPEDCTNADYDGRNPANGLDTFKGRLAFLRKVFRGRQAVTRTQHGKFPQHIKSMLKSGKCHEELLKDLSDSVDNSQRRLEKTNEAPTPLARENPDITPLPPNHSKAESAKASAPDRCSRYELESLFGGRRLRDHGVLPALGDGIRIDNTCDEVQTVGKLVNMHRGRRRKQTDTKGIAPLDVVGVDIGCGVPNGPGGHECVLALVDKCTSHAWICGMHGTSGNDVQEALWKFFMDAGGFPRTMQCDFDPRFIGGKAAKLLRAHGCHMRAAPPNWQSQSGLVERRWQALERMARTFLTNAKLPKTFWHWAMREAARRVNLSPISANPANPHDPASMTTPFAAFCGTKPDHRVLFPFGSMGSFRRPKDGCKARHTFDSQGMMGIALGRSEFTNGMIFHDPTLDSFCTSADCRLDPHQSIAEHFPTAVCDGGLTTSALSSNNKSPCEFNAEDTVFAKVDGTDNVEKGTVATLPTSLAPEHTVRLEDGRTIDATSEQLHPEGSNPEATPSVTLGFFAPDWLRQDCQVTLPHDGTHQRGHLNLDADNDWEFVTRDRHGRIADRIPLLDLNCSWKHRLQENSLTLGWQDDVVRRCVGIGRHVSAANPHRTIAPSNLPKGLAASNPDAKIWREAHDEECDGLRGFDTFAEIAEDECQQLLAEHGARCKAIPTMNAFTIEKDKEGNPVRAKSRIVVLGNLERRIWDKADRCAPAISAAGSRSLISMAVHDGRMMKQGDCKNAFCQPTLPDDEITIVVPPKGCPRSEPGTCWKPQKTLCGLARSPRHWLNQFSGALRAMGFTSMPHDPCVFKCTPVEGHPPICLGCCVDDFIHCSKSDAAEEWFEQTLGSQIRVDLMGAASWFLGSACDWSCLKDGRPTCHISQQACVDGLAEKFGLEESKPTETPCRSGLVIDRIERDKLKPTEKPEPVKSCQSLVGGINWLVTDTRPDIAVAADLLGQFSANPSQGHLTGAKHALRCLKTAASHGTRCTEGTNPLRRHASFPADESADDATLWTDACWGPQDASQPKPKDTRTCTMEEMHSPAGHHLSRMGGPLLWGAVREERIGGSSCEAEIKSMDAGVKEIQFLRHLMIELGLVDAEHTIPLMNDNRGAVDWAKTGGPASKKNRHVNLREFRVAECQHCGEVKCHWVPGKENPSDLFTKEHRDTAHFKRLRNFMVSSSASLPQNPSS